MEYHKTRLVELHRPVMRPCPVRHTVSNCPKHLGGLPISHIVDLLDIPMSADLLDTPMSMDLSGKIIFRTS